MAVWLNISMKILNDVVNQIFEIHPVYKPDDQSYNSGYNFNKILCPDILPNILWTTPWNDVILILNEQY